MKTSPKNVLQIKVCGLCCLVCALTCVLVTITTTVIHMNRLQTLKECVYTVKTRTCTCYSILLEAQSTNDDGMILVTHCFSVRYSLMRLQECVTCLTQHQTVKSFMVPCIPVSGPCLVCLLVEFWSVYFPVCWCINC